MSEVAEVAVVGRGLPFQRTADAATKPDPVTVSERAGPVAVALTGKMAEMAGVGLLAVATLKVEAEEVPEGSATVTDMDPAAAISAAGICALTDEEEPKVVGRALPFQSTCEEDVKLLPRMASEKAAPPVSADAGAREEICGVPGTGGVTFDVLPPHPTSERMERGRSKDAASRLILMNGMEFRLGDLFQ